MVVGTWNRSLWIVPAIRPDERFRPSLTTEITPTPAALGSGSSRFSTTYSVRPLSSRPSALISWR
jgi:hypothetical protein